MFLPLWRRFGLAGPASTLRLRAIACAAALFLSHTGVAFADDPAVPTIRVRDAADSIDGNERDASSTDDGGQTLYRVGGRDVDYPEPEPEPEPEPAAPVPSTGEAIVGFALAYVGYPYVAAGNSPAGFDCSGFTQWVMLNTLGIDIGHGLAGQPGAGWWVDYGGWLPGDLVFFQNTYQAGLSHVGIYIGDGLFVHAENEGTGVTISSMYSAYYSSRYWGSVRVA